MSETLTLIDGQPMIDVKAQKEFKAFASKCSDCQILCEINNSEVQMTLTGKDAKGNQHTATAQIAPPWIKFKPDKFVGAVWEGLRMLFWPGPEFNPRSLGDRVFMQVTLLWKLEGNDDNRYPVIHEVPKRMLKKKVARTLG